MRHKEFDETQVIQKAMLVFWRKGYEATSLADLSNAMQLGKASIYNAFGNKKAVFQKSLAMYLSTVRADLEAELTKPKNPLRGIEQMLRAVVNLHFTTMHPGGCMVTTAAAETNQHEGDTQKLVREAIFSLRDLIEARLSEAKDQSTLKSNIDPYIIANTLLSLAFGTLVTAQGGAKKEDLLKSTRYYVRSLKQ